EAFPQPSHLPAPPTLTHFAVSFSVIDKAVHVLLFWNVQAPLQYHISWTSTLNGRRLRCHSTTQLVACLSLHWPSHSSSSFVASSSSPAKHACSTYPCWYAMS